MTLRKLIGNNDREAIRQILAEHPEFANEGLPYDENNTATAPPLHRICDDVFSGHISDEQGVEMAKIFLEYGADINGGAMVIRKDTPLLAAASLHADQVAFLYIENGADIHHQGCHGGTALHWAAWCGRDQVVRRLLQEGPSINQLCLDFKSTPLFWAVHGLKQGDKKDFSHHLECVRLLVEAGADKTIPNADGKTVFDLADAGDVELKKILE